MGTFYVDDFDVNRCNDSKTSDLHGVVLRRSRTYSRRAIYRRRAGKGCGYAGNKTHARANNRYLLCKNGASNFMTASDWAEHKKCCFL